MFALLATLPGTPTLFAQETSANDETASNNEARLIREDRIWEYSSCWGFWQPATFQMKFDGTVEKEGKTWHRLQVINSSKYDYGNGWINDVKYTEYEPADGFLMREENGVVYLYEPEPYRGDIPAEHEVVLYNFNLEKDDSMDVWMNFGDYETREATEVKIITDRNGMQRKQITLSPKEGTFGYDNVEIVEGIGVVSMGTLPFIETDMLTDSYMDDDHTTFPNRFHGEELLRVMDLDGNVIYGDSDYEPHIYPKIINERNVWVYEKLTPDDSTIECFFKFDGSVVLDGTVYHEFKQIRETKTGRTSDVSPITTIYDKSMDITRAYLRERDHRVYMRGRSNSKEVVLYDFNRQPKEEYPVYKFEYFLYDDEKSNEQTMQDEDVMAVEGYDFKVQWSDRVRHQNTTANDGGKIYPRPYVEGVGNCGYGLLYILEPNQAKEYKFSRLINDEGYVILSVDQLDKINPVTAVESAVADRLTLNTASDMVTAASSATAVVRIKAVTADGITVAEAEGAGSVSIDLRQLPAGIYVIHASDGSSSRMAKVAVR